MQNTDLEDFSLSRMILNFSCSVTRFYASLSQHILLSSLVQMCHTQGFFHHGKGKATDATKAPIAVGLNLPSPSSGHRNFSLVAEFGSGNFPFLLLPWLLVSGPSSASLFPLSRVGKLGWEGELSNSGLAPLSSQEGNEHNANVDCCFWKGANPGATTKALLCSWDYSTVCCP